MWIEPNEKRTVVDPQPLIMPPSLTKRQKIVHFFTFFPPFNLGPVAKSLASQMKLRPPVPKEVWGTDPVRQETAAKIAGIIADVLEWPNAHFIPKDPMSIVLTGMLVPGLCGDGLIVDECLSHIAGLIGYEITQDDVDRMLSMTFAEAIDYLVAQKPYRAPLKPSGLRKWLGKSAGVE